MFRKESYYETINTHTNSYQSYDNDTNSKCICLHREQQHW